MYVPATNELRDDRQIDELLRRYDFAAIVSATPDGLVATQVPVVARRTAAGLTLVGHLARANPHWRAMDGRAPAVAIFTGPHDYVSPTWYSQTPAVPTWNYATVHAHGAPRAIEDQAFIAAHLAELVARHETGPGAWRVDAQPEGFVENLARAIVAFELPVVRLEAKVKMGQNRSALDRRGTIAGLERAGTPEAAALAAFMRAHAGPP
jgi:transcriptional regulator